VCDVTRIVECPRILWLGHRVAAVNLQRLVNLGLTRRADRWAVT
jgi:hypothetical protein